MKLPLLSLACYLLTLASAPAIILYGGDNSTNITDPGTGAPWDAVAKVVSSTGATTGSAVYLGNGYLLTANHLAASTEVTFDGVNFYTIDPSYSSSFTGGVDLKIFKLTETPSIAGVSLLDSPLEYSGEITLIGWGVGRNATPINTNVVGWGDGSTITKRWGLNVLSGAATVEGYSGLIFHLNTPGEGGGLGANEAALTRYDSGSGMFQFINGQWYLISIATGVQTSNSSTFGNPGDLNAGVRISAYYSQIMMNIPAIPEPSSLALLFPACLGGALWVMKRKRSAGK